MACGWTSSANFFTIKRKRGSLLSSLHMEGDGECPTLVKQHDTNYISVFALVHFHENPYQGPHERGKKRCNWTSSSRPTTMLHPLTKFFDKGVVDLTCGSILAGERFNINSKLYMLRGHIHTSISTIPTPSDLLRGYIFDTKTKSFHNFKGPKGMKPYGTFGKLYYHATQYDYPHWPSESVKPTFERRDWNSVKADKCGSYPFRGRAVIAGNNIVEYQSATNKITN
ncbi:hypothetical protein DVH24_000286 [Malus domestica]|uniref:Uncharacterized protein n=1 Tax=Malus domestica TaxID=3750 RepID=A0A498J278_MALDO|nr:hypothetical protein DVH24_000286 [Malus domestica]